MKQFSLKSLNNKCYHLPENNSLDMNFGKVSVDLLVLVILKIRVTLNLNI